MSNRYKKKKKTSKNSNYNYIPEGQVAAMNKRAEEKRQENKKEHRIKMIELAVLAVITIVFVILELLNSMEGANFVYSLTFAIFCAVLYSDTRDKRPVYSKICAAFGIVFAIYWCILVFNNVR